MQSEGRSGTVAEQPFDACPVLALDADGRIDAEPTGPLPGEHAVSVGFVEQAVAMEVAEHTALDNVLEFVPVLGLKEGGLMEADLPAVGLREHAIEHNRVKVEMRVEAGAESMKEAERP